jgi:uncharacterized protein (TIGR03437 family)
MNYLNGRQRLTYGLTVLLFASTAIAQDPDNDREPPDLQARRAEYARRKFGSSGQDRLSAWNQVRAMHPVSFKAPPGSPALQAAADQWTNIGPKPVLQPLGGNEGGRVNSIAVDPRDSNVIWIGTADAGVWRTRDGGANWTPLTDAQPSPAIGAVALDPNKPDTVYAGMGDPLGYSGAGLLKSTDGGGTWTVISQPFASGYGGHRFTAISVSPTNGQVVLASVYPPASGVTHAGIYRSIDGGATWVQTMSAPYVMQVFFHPTDGATAYAASGDDTVNTPPKNGLFKSSDGGVTWSPMNGTGSNALPIASAFYFRLAQSASSPLTMIASLSAPNPTGLVGLYKTTDGGATWIRLSTAPNYCSVQCGYSNVIAIHPTNPNAMYLGGIFCYRSIDGGNTFGDITPGYVDFHSIAFSNGGGTAFFGNDGGAWAVPSPNATPIAAVNSLNNTLSITQFYGGISIHPTNVNYGYGGAQDTGIHRYTGSLGWSRFGSFAGGGCSDNGGDAGYTAIDYKTPANAYLTCIKNVIFKTANNGDNWARAMTGIDVTDRSDFVAPIVMDPVNPQRLYYVTYRVYQSSDGAATWTPISGDITGLSGHGVIVDLKVAPSDPNTVWIAASDNKIQMTANAGAGTGAIWTDRTKGLPTANWGAVAIDSHDPKTVFVGIAAIGSFTVYRTRDAGLTWTNVTGTLPHINVHYLLADPDLSGTVFAGTELGVFVTTDNGATWNPLASGLPYVSVTGLALQHATRTLRAGTYGRGMWDLAVPLPPVPATTLAGVTNGASFASGPVAPGEIFTIFAASAGPTALTGGTVTAGFVDSSVSLVRVLFDGIPAPLLYVSATQIAGIVPYAVDGKSNTQLVVEYRGQQSAALTVPVAASSPAVFMLDTNRQGAILNQDNTVNSATNPAAIGSYIVVFATGEGQTDPAGVDGKVATAVYPKPKLPVSLSIGGVDAPIAYAGAAPSGVAGAFQVNAVVPAGVTPGSAVPVVLKVGAVSSPVVYVALR